MAYLCDGFLDFFFLRALFFKCNWKREEKKGNDRYVIIYRNNLWNNKQNQNRDNNIFFQVKHSWKNLKISSCTLPIPTSPLLCCAATVLIPTALRSSLAINRETSWAKLEVGTFPFRVNLYWHFFLHIFDSRIRMKYKRNIGLSK